jgi:hypothetical protein
MCGGWLRDEIRRGGLGRASMESEARPVNPVGKEYSMASVSKLPTPKPPSAGTVHWLNECISRSRGGVFTEITTMTPGLAAELLRRNEDNRNIKATKAQHFAADMIGGRWTFNGEPIIIAADGSLNDGQHRLQGLIEANITLPMMLVFGVSRESRMTIDQGSARCAGDYLSMGGTLYAKNAATAAKFIIAFERSDGRNIAQRAKITNAEIVARVRADDGIVKSAQYAHSHLKSYRHLVSHTVMATCHYLLSDVHPADAVEFLNHVALGENIRRADPAYAVRTAFQNEKRERQDAMEVIFHGWNKFRSGGDLKLIRVNGQFPALI